MGSCYSSGLVKIGDDAVKWRPWKVGLQCESRQAGHIPKKAVMLYISQESPPVQPIDYSRFGILVKFRVRGGISEFLYIHLIYIHISTSSFICPLIIHPGVIISGHRHM